MSCGSASTSGDGCGDGGLAFSTTDFPWVLQYEFNIDGQDVDLTGLTMVLIFKADISDADSAAIHQVDFSVPVGDDATNGIVAVVLGSVDIGALPVGIYYLKTQTSDGNDPPIVQTYGDPIQFEVTE